MIYKCWECFTKAGNDSQMQQELLVRFVRLHFTLLIIEYYYEIKGIYCRNDPSIRILFRTFCLQISQEGMFCREVEFYCHRFPYDKSGGFIRGEQSILTYVFAFNLSIEIHSYMKIHINKNDISKFISFSSSMSLYNMLGKIYSIYIMNFH